ncbi:MAG: T9SS type A sorting domain-containing protein [Saprospiraceae bacterium]
MNVCLRNTFVSLWLLIGAVSLSAQGASFYFPFINNAAPGSIKLLPLKVVNLDSVVAMQLVIRWDPAVLKYINIDNFNFSDLNLGDFNVSRAIDSGYVRLQWEGSSVPPGVSAPDSSTIFRMRFNVIGPDTSSTPVKITELLEFPPTYFEIVKVRPDTSNEDYTLMECPRTNGFVAVGFTVAANEPAANEVPLSLSPNPFSVSSQLQFELDQTADVQVFITDALGRMVFEKRFFKLPPGQHGMVIENSMLAVSGLYSLRLQAGRKTTTRSFVLF